LSVLATMLLNLRDAARAPDAEDRPASDLVSQDYIDVLVHHYPTRLNGQGNRTLNRCKTSINLIKHVLIPSGSEPFAANVLFDGNVALKNCQSHAAEGPGNFRG
jgi:hypothetical protein